MGEKHYLTADAIVWARSQLANLKKDQAALLWCLILSKTPTVQYDSSQKSDFVIEFNRYFGAPIPGRGVGVFSPIDSKWKAENYLQSTVLGRLLNGSHWWTSPDRGFLERAPKDKWPAHFSFNKEGADRLFLRKGAPSTSGVARLPLAAIAIFYYRFDPLSLGADPSIEELVDLYKQEVLSLNPLLCELFEADTAVYWGQLFADISLSEQERMSCFPSSPYGGEAKQNALLYVEDVRELHQRLGEGETIADLVRHFLRASEEI
jgi:hypothetical protein